VRHEIAWIEIPLREQRPFLVILPGRADPRDAARRRRRAASAKPDEIVLLPDTPDGLCGAWPDQVYQWHREGFELPHGAELLADPTIFPCKHYGSATLSGSSFIPA